MCILSEIYVWTKIIEMKAAELNTHFQQNLSRSATPRQQGAGIVIKLNWVLDYHI